MEKEVMDTIWSDMPSRVKQSKKDEEKRKKMWEKYDKSADKAWDKAEKGGYI